MDNNKNSVKLLPKIEKFEQYTAFYTEFDGMFEEDDKLYIMVIDSGSTDYILDSFQLIDSTYESIGYNLLKKEKNKIVLNIIYDDLIDSGVTEITDNNCYIGRVYIKEGNINRGSISGAMMYNVELNPPSTLSLLWDQGILVNTPGNIRNIDFNSKTQGKIVLKSEILNNRINTFNTIDNNDIGLSIINLTSNLFNLTDCNLNSGVFNNCQINGNNKNINNGIFNDCLIGPTYTINNGIFNDSTLLNDTIKWYNGRWNNSWVTGDSGTNPFRSFVWTNGVWENGVFPSISIWQDGKFLNGEFNGLWNGGTFGSLDGNPVFMTSEWNGGFFYGNSLFTGSTWNDGVFDSGTFENSNFNDGVFNNGDFVNSSWINGEFNNGNFQNSTWENGEFNNGNFQDSNWENGVFNNGLFINSTWENGNFHGGNFQDSDWLDGNFYKGSMFNSIWHSGTLFFGIMNSIEWSGGTWLNGIANNIDWLDGEWFNGVWNFGTFNKGTWHNGSFNNGTFGGQDFDSNSIWKFGNFYEGTFRGVWEGGTFFIGNVISGTPPPMQLDRKFIQYNKTGLVTNTRKSRIPSKRRF